jgi:hypothetical protein
MRNLQLLAIQWLIGVAIWVEWGGGGALGLKSVR